MRKTLGSCKRFILFYYLFSLFAPIPFIIAAATMDTMNPFFALVMPLLFIIGILSISFIIVGLIGLRLYTYQIDGHEVICFESFHVFMIVDEQIVDKAWGSSFHPPVLEHKLGKKHLEYSHRRLKVDGEMVMPKHK